jgi:hypothetical protein
VIVHLKLQRISSFKPVTRQQPFLCCSGRPAFDSYIRVFEGERETTEQVRERLKRLDPKGTLCEDCATEHEKS